MGRPLHGKSFVRFSLITRPLKSFLCFLSSIIGLLSPLLLIGCEQTRFNKEEKEVFVEKKIEAVAALGQLVTAGNVRRLAAPISGFGGTPRVVKLLKEEGDSVKSGDVIAVFDSRPQIIADLIGLRLRVRTLSKEITIKRKEISRYKKSAMQGATSLVFIEEKESQLINLIGVRQTILAQIIGLEADLVDSQLLSPIDGIVLRINSRPGERPGADGVVEIGDNNYMEALIEVYESDINRINLGQKVILTSENGGFQGYLNGYVSRISPQVRQRYTLSTDPTGDADARIVQVLVTLEPESSKLVNSLTGMKVIARFTP